jgi:F0F1-type ATP synthase epsilon subunit
LGAGAELRDLLDALLATVVELLEAERGTLYLVDGGAAPRRSSTCTILARTSASTPRSID